MSDPLERNPGTGLKVGHYNGERQRLRRATQDPPSQNEDGAPTAGDNTGRRNRLLFPQRARESFALLAGFHL